MTPKDGTSVHVDRRTSAMAAMVSGLRDDVALTNARPNWYVHEKPNAIASATVSAAVMTTSSATAARMSAVLVECVMGPCVRISGAILLLSRKLFSYPSSDQLLHVVDHCCLASGIP